MHLAVLLLLTWENHTTGLCHVTGADTDFFYNFYSVLGFDMKISALVPGKTNL